MGCPGWSWNEIFATAKDLGINGIEIRGIGKEMFAPKIPELNAEEWQKNSAKLAKAGMKIPMLASGACLGTDNLEQYLAEAKDYIDFARTIGVPFVRVMVSAVPEPTGKENLPQTMQAYRQLCEYAAGKNVMVLLETNGILANSKVMRDVMEKTDLATAGVLWDIHHPFRYYNESPEETYQNLKPWIRYLHVKDSVMQNDKVQYRMMGYGDVPVFDTLKVLHKDGYEGFITLEWVKRWSPDLQEPGIVFAHYVSYMNYLFNQLDNE